MAQHPVGTAAAYIAQLRLRFGKPYSETADGGVGPDFYDCSGLTEVCLNDIGIPFTRSTYTQWDDERYEHFGPFSFGQWAALLPLLQIGDVLYFHVDGEPDPGHVGTYVGDGQMIEAPHTGTVVGQYGIPNTPGEHVFGVIRPPFATTPAPTPTPAPPEPDTKEYKVMDSVALPDGTIVSHAATPAGHYLEITRAPGKAGHPATDGLSVIDVTAQYPQFTVQP